MENDVRRREILGKILELVVVYLSGSHSISFSSSRFHHIFIPLQSRRFLSAYTFVVESWVFIIASRCEVIPLSGNYFVSIVVSLYICLLLSVILSHVQWIVTALSSLFMYTNVTGR